MVACTGKLDWLLLSEGLRCVDKQARAFSFSSSIFVAVVPVRCFCCGCLFSLTLFAASRCQLTFALHSCVRLMQIGSKPEQQCSDHRWICVDVELAAAKDKKGKSA